MPETLTLPSSSQGVRSALEEAKAERRVIRIRYASLNDTTATRDIEPVLFASTSGRWHLRGWCSLRYAMRWFVTSSIGRARVTMMACSGRTIHEVGEHPENARPVHSGGE